MIGETRVTRVTKPVASISPPKMPVKEQWELKPSPKGKAGGWVKETEELWLCPREDCSYMGATAAKMRLHLSCHGLDADEVESYAREETVMGRMLEKVSRTVYLGKAREILGSGPLSKASGEVVGNREVWDCRVPRLSSRQCFPRQTPHGRVLQRRLLAIYLNKQWLECD